VCDQCAYGRGRSISERSVQLSWGPYLLPFAQILHGALLHVAL